MDSFELLLQRIPDGCTILIHDGLQSVSQWESSSVSAASHVVQMVGIEYQAAKTRFYLIGVLWRLDCSVDRLS